MRYYPTAVITARAPFGILPFIRRGDDIVSNGMVYHCVDKLPEALVVADGVTIAGDQIDGLVNFEGLETRLYHTALYAIASGTVPPAEAQAWAHYLVHILPQMLPTTL